MPMNIQMLARIAADIYEDNDSQNRDYMVSHQRVDGTFVSNRRGFQAAVYRNEDELVVAYRGTASTGGVTADIRLALRDMPNQVGDALTFFKRSQKYNRDRGQKIIVCGHSLGGYLTQAICAEMGCWGIAFNPAGARSLFTGRVMGLGKTLDPQFLVFADASVLNITIRGDVVSSRIAGKMIGRKIHLGYGIGDPATAHFMTTVLKAVKATSLGEMNLDQGLEFAKTWTSLS